MSDFVKVENDKEYNPRNDPAYDGGIFGIGSAIGNECFRFGSWGGCAPRCPVFERGECELQEENMERFIEDGDMDEVDVQYHAVRIMASLGKDCANENT